MVDYDFEEQLEREEAIENFSEHRNWADFSYEENKTYLDNCDHLSFYNRLNLEYFLSLSKDAWLVEKGYYMHPLRIKRSKFQKIKKNKV